MEIVAKDNLILATVRMEPPYPATTISGQTWMAVNMSGDDGLGGISSYTWDNDWGTQYYYTLSAAKRIAASMYPGWHVPTKDEWNNLSAALYLTYIRPGFPPEDVHTRPGTAVGDVMRGQDGWAQAKTAYTDINVFSALPVDNYWYTTIGWTYPSAYSSEGYFIADDPTANSALHYSVLSWLDSSTILSAQYRPFEGYNQDAHLGAEMNSVRLVLDSTAQNTERPVIDKAYIINFDYNNPLDLPPFTIRLKYWLTPSQSQFKKGTATLVSSGPNNRTVWDLTYNDPDWSNLLSGHYYLEQVLGANTKGVTSMSGMFMGCQSLSDDVPAGSNYSGGVTLFDTSDVVNMDYMFADNTSFYHPSFKGPAISALPLYNTENVSSMKGMFKGGGMYGKFPALNTKNVVNMNYMFADCDSLSAVSLFDTENVSSMRGMFANCSGYEVGAKRNSGLTGIPLFNTTKVVDMGEMLEGCRDISSIPLLDTKNVSATFDMFNGCSSLSSLPQLNLTAVKDASIMFAGCFSLSSVPSFTLPSIAHTAGDGVTDMFLGCSSLKSVGTLRLPTVTGAVRLFKGCSALTAIPDVRFTKYQDMVTPHITDIESIFENCVNVETGITAFYQEYSASIYNSDNAFKNCGINTVQGAAELAQIPASWK